MAQAGLLVLEDIRPNSGRCPWRIQYRVDDIEVSAFFRPPIELARSIEPDEISIVALPILCDLAAEVRPRSVSLEHRDVPPFFRRVFADAVGALLLEQDAYWSRPSLTPLPKLQAQTAKPQHNETPLDPKRVILGFSGGKDSILSLFALLRSGYEVLPLLLNEGDRTWQDIRKWIPKLRNLGLQPLVAYLSVGRRKLLREKYGAGYFSSYQLGWLLAVLALCAMKAQAGVICLGIESSSDYSFKLFRRRKVNHQYQKTTKHLKLIEQFYQRVLHPGLRIASPIANVTDTEVLKALLEQVPRTFQSFSSCGSSNWRSKHCGQCAKCAFIFALLCASLKGRQLALRIFHGDLLEDVELYRPWLDNRFRMPPGCIGPRSEVWAVFEALVKAKCDKPVVEKWKDSQLRHGVYAPDGHRTLDNSARKNGSFLCLPVSDAAAAVQKWIDTP